MAKKMWNIEVDGTSHTVELEQWWVFGGKNIRVDGKQLDKKSIKKTKGLFSRGEDRFELAGHEVIIYTLSNRFTVQYDLALDGTSVQTGEPVVPLLPVPGWGWPLMILNAVIIFMGGAVPIAIGLVGTAICYRIARDPQKSLGKRAGWCVTVTALSWLVYFLVVVTMGRIIS
jgi:hypothetical protein